MFACRTSASNYKARIPGLSRKIGRGGMDMLGFGSRLDGGLTGFVIIMRGGYSANLAQRKILWQNTADRQD